MPAEGISGHSPVGDNSGVKGADMATRGPAGTPPSRTLRMRTMSDLERMDPTGYKKMLEALANEINKDSKKHVDRCKKIRQESERK